MDFTRTETQAAVAEAVAGALTTAAPAEELLTALPSRSVEDAGFDERLWSSFASSGLLSLGLPEALGGDDLSVADVAVVLEEVGRAGVVIPALETLGFGVLPIVALGTADQQKKLLEGIEDGRIITAAVAEPGSPLPAAPTVRLEGGRMSGTVTSVRYAAQARSVLVPVSTPEGETFVVVVSPDAPGVTLTPTLGSLGVPEYAVRFEATPVDDDDVLRGGGDESVLEVFHRLVLAACIAHGDGLISGAMDMTADYLKEREQFGKPLGSFQAVQQELADVYIVSRTLHVIAQSVAWRIAEGLTGADDRYATDPIIGAFWLASEGPRAVQVLHHLHGGVGVDVTYPMFRYSSAVKDLARFVGGSRLQLTALGEAVAADPIDAVAPAGGDAEADEGEAFIDLTPAQRALQAELREYFSTLISADEAADIATTRHGETYEEIIKRMGRDGWLGVGWPTEYGGKGFGHIEQQIFTNEATRADVPLPSVTLQTVGPTLQKYGTQAQKDKFLPGILDGTVHFAIGYSEPDAGTDLASLRTTAKRDEATGDWIINGQKMWTTGGHHADYIWLAARTGTPDSRHRGLTIFIVDTSDPGFSFTPIIPCDGAHHVNATYYSDVRVPADMVVG